MPTKVIFLTYYFNSLEGVFAFNKEIEAIIFMGLAGGIIITVLSLGFQHLIVLLMLLEVGLVILSLGIAILGVTWFGTVGLLFSYVLLILVGGESALALAVVTSYFFVEQQVAVEFVNKLKG